MASPGPGCEQMIKALFFAQLADQAGSDSAEIDYCGDMTARDLISALEPQIDAAALETLKHDVVMLSVNKKLAGWDDVLKDGDEVGFLPPFSGG